MNVETISLDQTSHNKFLVSTITAPRELKVAFSLPDKTFTPLLLPRYFFNLGCSPCMLLPCTPNSNTMSGEHEAFTIPSRLSWGAEQKPFFTHHSLAGLRHYSSLFSPPTATLPVVYCHLLPVYYDSAVCCLKCLHPYANTQPLVLILCPHEVVQLGTTRDTRQLYRRARDL